MAACSSLRSLFETPLPENPTLMESLTWSQTKHNKPMEHSVTELFGELHFQEKTGSDEDKHRRNCSNPLDTLFHSGKDNNYKCNMNMDSYKSNDQKPMEQPAFTEIFGELHFQEKPQPIEESRCRKTESIIDSLFKQNMNPTLDSLLGGKNTYKASFDSKSSGNFSHKNSESLQKCTEGLGSESSDDVDDLVSESDYDWKSDDQGKEEKSCNVSSSMDRRMRIGGGLGFPPPISSIGRSGKPRVCFKSFREGGRFVLREIRIPNHELLSASRHDGRLKLQFIQPESDIAEEEEEEQTEEERQEGESSVDNRGTCGGKE